MSSHVRASHDGHHLHGLLLLTFLMVGVSLIWATAAWAAPVNDDLATATAITALPFSDTVDTSAATLEAGEPQFCAFSSNTVWYSVTPTQDGVLTADTTGSPALSQVTAYSTGNGGFGGLAFQSCANFGFGRAALTVHAGQTYALQVSSLFGDVGAVNIHVAKVAPPANDDFANATPVGAVPFADTVDLAAATFEPGEPGGCATSIGDETAWYAFTPRVSGSYVAARGDFGGLGVFTGDSLATLTAATTSSCSFNGSYFHADAGTTYHLQVSAPAGSAQDPVSVSFTEAPPASAGFFFFPFDPSNLDDVQFFSTGFDPAGFSSQLWAFGDTSTGSGCCVTHRYAADGDYDANLAVTTTDGRTASATQTVHVRTHDIAITKFAAPNVGRVGTSKQLNVVVSNSRYAETVQVAILRSVPGGGFEQVGQLTEGVPGRSTRKSTTFSISYTFEPQDATVGKVSFEAVATIISARDANPADNTAIAAPTRVTR